VITEVETESVIRASVKRVIETNFFKVNLNEEERASYVICTTKILMRALKNIERNKAQEDI